MYNIYIKYIMYIIYVYICIHICVGIRIHWKIQTIQPFCGQMFGDPSHHHTWCNLMAWWPAISFGKLPIPLAFWWSKIYLYRLSRYMTCWYNCYISRYIPIHCTIYLYSYSIYLCYKCLTSLNMIECIQFLFSSHPHVSSQQQK